jgi:hypothetical protein
MKYIFNYLFIFVTATILFSSCGEDFLYKAPQGSIDENALQNETGVNLLTG